MKLPTPAVRVSLKGFAFNAACMQIMPDVGYVQFQYYFKTGFLCAVECGKNDEHSIPWRANCNSREVRAKNVRWPRFYKLICDGMGWIAGNDYTIPAILEDFDGKRCIYFNLSDRKEKSPFWNMKLSDLQPVDVAAEMDIRRYEPECADQLFALIEREGDEWKDYWYGEEKAKYKKALANSIVYLVFEGETLCGYARCRDDDGYGVYVYDLLVDQEHRGKEYGRLLMEQVCEDFPNDPVYAMSDVDPYYEKLGYGRAGAIFIVNPQ